MSAVCELHTEHARRSGVTVGRHFDGPNPDGYWERCRVEETAAPLLHQRDLLGEVLGRILVHLGCVNDNVPLTVPLLLMAAEEYLGGGES